MSLLGEIRRRKVFQVAAAYAIVAWLIVQVIGAINEPLNLPDRLDTVVIVLLGVGFPIAVILAWVFELSPQGIAAETPRRQRTGDEPSALPKLAYASQVLILLAVAFLVFDQYFAGGDTRAGGTSEVSGSGPDGPSGIVRRFNLDLGISYGGLIRTTQMAFSPDGSMLAFQVQARPTDRAATLASRSSALELWLRPLDQLEALPIAGATGVQEAFFSPDGRWIAYENIGSGQLEKIPVEGGPPQALLNQPINLQFGSFMWDGADWSPDGEVFFSDQIEPNDRRRAIYRVPDGGGPREQVSHPPDEIDHSWQSVLPGGQALTYTARDVTANDPAAGWIEIYDPAAGRATRIIDNAYNARYAPSGHIVFVRGRNLWAVAFDLQSLRIVGNESIVVDDVETEPISGKTSYAVSGNGLLAYTPSFEPPTTRRLRTLTLSWVTNDGSSSDAGIAPDALGGLRLSPDGGRVAIVRGADIWIYDLARGTATRLTTHPASDHQPLWTPDGEWVVFGSLRDDGGLFRRRANGLGEVERLTTSPGSARQHFPDSFSPDGQLLVFTEGQPFGSDIMLLDLGGDREVAPLIAEADFDEDLAAVSPDGRWIAYESDETGTTEIYVRPFPEVGENRWVVSAGGGRQPAWSADSTALYFLRDEVSGPLFSVSVGDGSAGPAFGAPEIVFTRDIPQPASGPQPAMRYAPAGDRFLVLDEAPGGTETNDTPARSVIVEGWFTELERLAPRTD